MASQTTAQACFNCSATETDSPLISLRFSGRGIWICPQCMPVLIHDTTKLARKLNEMADGAGS